MNFDFDFDAPFGVLSDVLQKFEPQSSCSLDEALIELIQFDTIDLTEHSQWQDLVDILDNVISHRINGDRKVFKLLCVVIVRFLQGLDSMYQKEDSLLLACKVFRASLELPTSNTVEMIIPGHSHNGILTSILMKIYFQELAATCTYSQSEQIESLFSFSISLLQREYYDHGISVLDSSETLYSFVQAIESFRKTAVAIIIMETNFFVFALQYVSSKIQEEGTISQKSWRGLLILLLSMCSINPHYCETYSKISLFDMQKEHSCSVCVPAKPCKRIHILNKMFSVQNSLSNPLEYISTPSSSRISLESTVWLNQFLESGLKLHLAENILSEYAIKILTIILDTFGPSSCGSFLKKILENVPLRDISLCASNIDFLCEICSFLSQRFSIQEIRLDSNLSNVVLSLLRWNVNTSSVSLSFLPLLNIADFVLIFADLLSENEIPLQASCLMKYLHRFPVIFQTESVSDQSVCKLLFTSCRMLKFAFRWLPMGEQRNNLVQECAQILLLVTQKKDYCADSPVWYLVVDLVMMAAVLGTVPSFLSPVHGLFVKASKSIDILESSRDDTAFSQKENFTWSLRQLAAGLNLIGSIQAEDAIGYCMRNCFPDLLDVNQPLSMNLSFHSSKCDFACSNLRMVFNSKFADLPKSSKDVTRDIIVTEDLLNFSLSNIDISSLESEKINSPLFFPSVELMSESVKEHNACAKTSIASIEVGSVISSFIFDELSVLLISDYVRELLAISGLKSLCAFLEGIALVPLEIITFALLRNRFLSLFSLNECIAFAYLGRTKGWLLTYTIIIASAIKLIGSRLQRIKVKGYEAVFNNLFSGDISFGELLETMNMFVNDPFCVNFLLTVAK